MTDLPAHQILYDLQYARGGEGDERKFVNVTDISGPHADALLAQIERDQIERERIRLHQEQQQQPQPLAPTTSIPATTNGNAVAPGSYSIGFGRQHEQILQSQQDSIRRPTYPIGFEQPYGDALQPPSNLYDPDEARRKSEAILERRRIQEQEKKEAERIAFGNIEDERPQRRVSYEPTVQVFDSDEPVCLFFLMNTKISVIIIIILGYAFGLSNTAATYHTTHIG